MASTSKAPTSFMDGISAAMQDLAGAMAAPDADLHFGSEVMKLMGSYIQSKHNPQGQKPGAGAAPGQGAPSAGGQPPGAGAPPSGGAPPSAAGGGPSPISGGPAGGGAGNQQMPSLQAPTAPQSPGSGPTPGLTPDPDELRRVLQEVAGQ